MADLVGARKLAGLILGLWILSGTIAAAHVHCDCCDQHDGDDDAPCSICLVVHHVTLITLAKAETFEREREVVAWITPWIALLSEDVFFDRPLARGPPAVS
jgi:hypothetical protein